MALLMRAGRLCMRNSNGLRNSSASIWLPAKWNNQVKKPEGMSDEEFHIRREKANSFGLLIGSSIGIVVSGYLLYKRHNVQAASSVSEEANDNTDTSVVHKSQAGFKERKIIEYENRIRQYSTPDKIFRYFATLQDAANGEIYMTPEDFVRALTPDTMQPHGLGLDKFTKVDQKHIPPYTSQHFHEDSVFYCFGEKGLVSFSDYIFLLTILGTSSRNIYIAFRMFDINGDGEVTVEEFEKVHSLFLNMSTTGSRHRDRTTTGNVLSGEVNSGLTTYFFGEERTEKLTVDKFIAFKRKLQQEVMFLEFNSFNPVEGAITEYKFAEMLLTYANFPKQKHQKIMKRMKKLYGKQLKEDGGLMFNDYLSFFSFLLNIKDVEMALSFHTVAGHDIDKETFKQVGKSVAGVELRDHLVDVVFTIFDENEDGKLSNKEFIAVMKDKLVRGLNKPKDTGFTRLITAALNCAQITVADTWSSSEKAQ